MIDYFTGTRSWVSLMPIIVALLKYGTEANQAMAEEELMALAHAADAQDALNLDACVERLNRDSVAGIDPVA